MLEYFCTLSLLRQFASSNHLACSAKFSFAFVQRTKVLVLLEEVLQNYALSSLYQYTKKAQPLLRLILLSHLINLPIQVIIKIIHASCFIVLVASWSVCIIISVIVVDVVVVVVSDYISCSKLVLICVVAHRYL